MKYAFIVRHGGVWFTRVMCWAMNVSASGFHERFGRAAGEQGRTSRMPRPDGDHEVERTLTQLHKQLRIRAFNDAPDRAGICRLETEHRIRGQGHGRDRRHLRRHERWFVGARATAHLVQRVVQKPNSLLYSPEQSFGGGGGQHVPRRVRSNGRAPTMAFSPVIEFDTA